MESHPTGPDRGGASIAPLRLLLAVGGIGLGFPAVVAPRPTARAQPGRPPAVVGRWDLVIRGDATTFPGWLEVRMDSSGLRGRLQWGSGHATAITGITTRADSFAFTWPDEENPKAEPSRARGRVTSGARQRLTAVLAGGDGKRYTLTGVPAPGLARQPVDTAEWGAPVDLLAGGLAGWRPRGPKSGWRYRDGVLENVVPASDLISKPTFTDFKLHIEVNVPPGGNSGIYLRGRDEVQVLDSYGRIPGSREMGGIYGQVTPTANAARPAGEWQSYDITLVGRIVTVVLNGVTIIDRQEVPGITGGALDSDEAAPGPIMLQGDHTAVAYRNIVLRQAVGRTGGQTRRREDAE